MNSTALFTATSETISGHHEVVIFNFSDPDIFFRTLARASEFTEHPVFHGRTFTFEELDQHWVETSGCKYADEIVGINLTAENLEGFFAAYSGLLSAEEESLRTWLKDTGHLDAKASVRSPFYVLAINDRYDESVRKHVLKHEMSHALYYFDQEYREHAHKVWDSLTPEDKEAYGKHLSKNYVPERYVDECVAHLIAGDGEGQEPAIPFDDMDRTWDLYEAKIPSELIYRILTGRTEHKDV